MRINNNIMALNAHRQLSVNHFNMSKSLERLSSGLRINRAGDDAAGLAISEKMRGQIAGLRQAQRNAQDGISMIQTAEGALNETHSILQRMRELAVQSANDTNTAVDRAEIQKEIDQLAAELTRIGNNTEFNTQNLLDGTLDVIFQIGANKGQNLGLQVNDMRADALGVAGEGGIGFLVTSSQADSALAGDETFTVAELETVVEVDDGDGNSINARYALIDSNGEVAAVSEDGTEYWALAAASTVEDLDNAEIAGDMGNDAGFVFDDPVIRGTVTSNADGDVLTGAATLEFEGDAKLSAGTYEVVDDTHAMVGAGEFGLIDGNGELVGYSTDGQTWTTLGGDALFTSGTDLGAAGTQITVEADGGIDVSSQTAADSAIEVIDNAIATVSAERSKLGALQNRLEHTISNLGTAAENLQAAESRIRDVDMAQEMMNFTRNQILQQASTAMLAQANMAPQGVLQLLG